MKVFVVVNNYGEKAQGTPKSWYLLADSAVSNTGKPFYLPETKGRVTVSLSEAIRFQRLGKFISPKFAARYYSEVAPALHFRLPDLEQRLTEASLPGDAARSFDRSLFVGDFVPFSPALKYALKVNGEIKAEFTETSCATKLDDLIAEVSEMNTIKMGDILIPGLSGEIELHEGDLLEVLEDGKLMFHVKVK